MGDSLIVISFLICLFLLELVYFRVAVIFKIIDKPNERSSHSRYTVRGGGIVFPAAVLGWWLFFGFQLPFFVAGLLLISIISFVDDLSHVRSHIRFFFHLSAVVMVLLTIPFSLEWYWYVPIAIAMIGTINAWNFMDGINGITGGYSLVTVGTLLYINYFVHKFTQDPLLFTIIVGIGVFNYFNFRRKAVCFAGDVGSVSIAFIICYLIIQLIFSSQNLLFIGLILLYGLDTTTTLIFRAIRKENIFQAHRSHFYQFLVNEQNWPHLTIAAFYSGLQLLINVLLITQFPGTSTVSSSGAELLLLLSVSSIAFLAIRFFLEGTRHLMGVKDSKRAEIR